MKSFFVKVLLPCFLVFTLIGIVFFLYTSNKLSFLSNLKDKKGSVLVGKDFIALPKEEIENILKESPGKFILPVYVNNKTGIRVVEWQKTGKMVLINNPDGRVIFNPSLNPIEIVILGERREMLAAKINKSNFDVVVNIKEGYTTIKNSSENTFSDLIARDFIDSPGTSDYGTFSVIIAEVYIEQGRKEPVGDASKSLLKDVKTGRWITLKK